MKLHYFVCGSSVILSGWLGLTFVVHVPVQRYQKADVSATTSHTRDQTTALAGAVATPAADIPVSFSR